MSGQVQVNSADLRSHAGQVDGIGDGLEVGEGRARPLGRQTSVPPGMWVDDLATESARLDAQGWKREAAGEHEGVCPVAFAFHASPLGMRLELGDIGNLRLRPGQSAEVPIEVVFSDVAMPGSMDGVALATQVAARWPRIRLVVTSGRSCMSDGDLPDAGRFLPKPYHQSDLLDVIASAA